MVDPSDSKRDTQPGRGSGDDETLTLDATFELLSDHRRRAVLGLLSSDGRPLTVWNLAKLIAERERGAATTELSEDDVLSIYIVLYHLHVPKLADARVVEYDDERERVAPTDRLERFEPFLSLSDELNSRST